MRAAPMPYLPAAFKRRRISALAALVVAAMAVIAAVVRYRHYENVERPARLREAGRVELAQLADTSCGVRPDADANHNGADFYISAINHFNLRRNRPQGGIALYAFADEPPVEPIEMALMAQGAGQRDCDLYQRAAGGARFQLAEQNRRTRWPMEWARDPYELRPYVTVFRVFCVAALNAGKHMERSGQRVEALRVYESIVRFGCHLRQQPGSFMDLQLGIELERRGLHYLDVFYAAPAYVSERTRIWDRGDRLRAYAGLLERKYRQLANPEVAMLVLRADSDPIWRIEAAGALHAAMARPGCGILDRWTLRRAMETARADSDPHVRAAADYLLRLAPAQLHSPGADTVG